MSFVNNTKEALRIDENSNVITHVNNSITLAVNNTMPAVLVNDTTLEFRVRGSDGVTRKATLSLA